MVIIQQHQTQTISSLLASLLPTQAYLFPTLTCLVPTSCFITTVKAHVQLSKRQLSIKRLNCMSNWLQRYTVPFTVQPVGSISHRSIAVTSVTQPQTLSHNCPMYRIHPQDNQLSQFHIFQLHNHPLSDHYP